MPEITKLLNFDEFRNASAEADALRQQRAFFSDPAAAEEVLSGGTGAKGWAEWPETAAKGWGVWDANVTVPVVR